MTVENIQDGVVVSLAYSLTVDGQVIEEASAQAPLDYLHGEDNIVPGLEKALTGKKVGDTLDITLSPEDGYGEYDPEEVLEVPLSDIPDADTLEEGMILVLEDDEGYEMEAIVSEIKGKTVILDLNDELAGKTLDYHVEVVALREATPDELEQGFPEGIFGEDDH